MTEIPGRAGGGTEQVARRFQRAWKEGERPRIEDYLAGVDQPLRPQVLESLLRVESDFRREAGEESSVDEYLARFPQHGEVVEAVFGTTASHLSAESDQTRNDGRSRETTAQGAAAETVPPDLASRDEYENIRVLGDGGMGVVYLAHNRIMGRDEVLKVMARHIVERPGTLERFAREIRAVAKLRHPNIVSAYTAFHCGGSLVFAMEYVEGLDLRKMVKARGALPVAQSCNYIYQAALGLQHAHEEGMVHRDIKPGNLMLSHRKGRAVIKLLDFGLAKATTEQNAIELRAAEAKSGREAAGHATRAGQMLGTPDFIAPEQIFDATQADIRADIYSLGCTLYYLLTGRPPFSLSTLREVLQAHMSLTAKPLNVVRQDVPAALAQVVAKMLAKNPEDRFQQPADVADALKPFFKQGDTAVKAVDLGAEAPFYQGAAQIPSAGAVTGLRPEPDGPEFEVLPDAAPQAPAGGAKGAANSRRAPTGEPSQKRAIATTRSPSAETAETAGATLLRRLQTPTGVLALTAVALGGITIAIVAFVSRSDPGTNRDSESPPAATTARARAASERTSVTQSANPPSPATAPAPPGAAGTGIAPKAKGTTPPPLGTAAEWVNRIGDMTVNVASARLVPKGKTNTRELEVILKISNASKEPMQFRRWSDPEIEVELKDQFQNYYSRTVERAETVSISPQHTIDDTLCFEPPQDQANLELHLPIPGTDDAFRISILSTSIERAVRLPAPPSALPGAEVAAPVKIDPTQDRRIRSAIIAEYREGISTIRQKAKFMNTNDAASLRKREPKVLIKSLAKKHNLTEDQVKTIVGP
jgi:serine/threonine protein kinase